MKTPLRKLLLLLGAASLMVLAATFYSLNTGRDIATRYTPLVNAAMEIKLEATTAHLWFEEAISGDRTIAIDTVWKHLDQSEWYAHAMLNGGANEEAVFTPLNDSTLRHQIEQTINGLRLFRQIAHQRWNEQSTSGIGSDIELQFDQAFSHFMLSTDNVETALQKVIAEDIQHFEFVEKLLILIIVIFTLSIGVLLSFYERMQTKTLQVLHDKEESLRITLNSIADAVIVTDTHGLITYMNPVAVGLTGWAAEQAVEQPILDVFNIVHADTREAVQSPVEKVLKTEAIVTLANHTVLIAKDGSEYQISDSAAPIFAADGSINGVVLIFRDVSEEYALHESIKKSEILIGTLINSLPDFIWLKDANGIYISCNAKVEEFFRAKKINIIGKTDHDFLDKKLADSFREHDLTVLKTNQALITEEQITFTADDRTEIVEVTRSPMTSADGELIGVLGIAHDITNRKKAEEKLRAAEERWNFVLEGTKDGVWDWNMETDEVYYSKELKAIWGYDETDITPSLTEWKAVIHPDDEEEVWQKLNKHFQHETTHYESEQRILRKNGAYKWILARGKVVAWTKDDKPLRMIGTHIDISERKETEERYRHIFNNSLTEIFIFDAETYLFLNVNRGAINNIGYSEEELLTLTPLDIKPEISLKQFNELVKPLREGTKEIIHFETVHQRKNGQLYPVEIHLQLTNDTLKPAFIAIILDITERKAAMDKLQLSSRVFSDTHEAIAITDVNSLIIDVNPAFYEITGYSREEALGQNPSFLSSGKQSPEFYQAMWQQINEQGHWQGEIWNRTKNGEFYAELLSISVLKDTLGNPINYVGLFSDITDSKHQQEKLSLMAHYDVLTGLPNRALFTDRFTQAIAHSKRTEHQLAVCFLDLDNFKPVNDKYGHEIGDKLLIEVAERITSCIREEDTVSRQGGDEFALLLNDIESVGQCAQTIDRIHHSLAKPYLIDGYPLEISASSGITLYPSDNGEIDTLLRHADKAMYQAKLAGRNCYQLYDQGEDQRTILKHDQLKGIESALTNNEFQLYYQPKVNMVTGDVFGVEALIRWIHPEKGLIPPLDFLPIIEDTELELKVGEWVINEALTQFEEWSLQGIKLEVSINISSTHLLSPTFFANLEAALAQHATVDPQYLQLEILESSALGDLNAITAVIEMCKGVLGVKVALDDFGTGYSSLTHLRSLPVDTIKIDQSFVRDMLDDPSDYTIIDGVIGLSGSFNRHVIAEGVETVNHGIMLLLMGCNNAQGYGIAKPMPAADIPRWLNDYMPNEEWLHVGNKHWTIKERNIKLFRLASGHWENRFIKSIQTLPENAEQPPIMNSTLCPCGSWIRRETQDKRFEAEGLKRLNQAHERVHTIAQNLRLQHQSGNINIAREGLTELKVAFEHMTNALGMCE